ncbi:hypothetical protein LJC58_07510 [Lachnospiraceae bacterium OttesenSCG-928-D06]|nr:hypothetical protein [Lachnospiraceae bacterium OttesenSCG-928-D06]
MEPNFRLEQLAPEKLTFIQTTFEEYYTFLTTLTLRILPSRNHELAESIVNCTFYLALKNADQLMSNPNLADWLVSTLQKIMVALMSPKYNENISTDESASEDDCN